MGHGSAASVPGVQHGTVFDKEEAVRVVVPGLFSYAPGVFRKVKDISFYSNVLPVFFLSGHFYFISHVFVIHIVVPVPWVTHASRAMSGPKAARPGKKDISCACHGMGTAGAQVSLLPREECPGAWDFDATDRITIFIREMQGFSLLYGFRRLWSC